MNERIRELAEHANYLATEKEFPYHEDWFYLYNKKFAELIVRECAAQVDWILAEGGKTQGDLIREHFYGEEL